MIQCSNCGRMLDDGCRFCPYCGSPVLIQNNMKPAANKKTTSKILIALITTFLLVISFIFGVLLFNVNNHLQKQSPELTGRTSENPGNNSSGHNAIKSEDLSKDESSHNKEEQQFSTEESDRGKEEQQPSAEKSDRGKEEQQPSAEKSDSSKDEGSTEAAASPVTIVLDPGRGGDNVGREIEYNSIKYAEKDINLRLASFLKEELLNFENVNVLMTRDGDYNIELEDRIKIAAGNNADMLISIHNDTHGDYDEFSDGCTILSSRGIFRPELAEKEQELAASILHELSAVGLTDRGILLREAENGVTYENGQIADYYAIIRNGVIQNVPSILIEHTSMDNSSDFEKYLSTDDALKKLAKADAIGIANYYGLIEKSSGDKYTLDSSWRELYSFIRFDELYNRHFCDYASSIFGSKATWRPPISMNWTFAKPDIDALGEVSSEELSSAGDYQDIIDYTFFYARNAQSVRAMGLLFGLEEGSSERFRDYFAEGNHIQLGINEQPSPFKITYNYGNPNFTVRGIKIGMTVDECRKLIDENYSYFSTRKNPDGTEYDLMTWAEYGSLQFVYGSDGTLKEWQEYLINKTAE